MKIVFITHPSFLNSQSMPRFAKMLAEGMHQRGHEVELYTAKAFFYQLNVPASLKKWFGYIDQYLIFPWQFKKKLKLIPFDTLFVFTDHALGPWVPIVKDRPHVIHCHDFLAQRSALGEIEENLTSYSGRKYQSYIRNGYKQGKNFISVSENTRLELQRFLKNRSISSHMVYNGLNQSFDTLQQTKAGATFSKRIGIDLVNGYILHVGGNQWYKNRTGVIEIYNAYRKSNTSKIKLLLLGAKPNQKLFDAFQNSEFKEDIHFLTGIEDEYIPMAYAGANVFLFPSLAEGFGWPIAEAMASGALVVTTGEAPMTEVGSQAAFYIQKRPSVKEKKQAWANEAAKMLVKVLCFPENTRKEAAEAGIQNAKKFNADDSLQKIEKIYLAVLKNEMS